MANILHGFISLAEIGFCQEVKARLKKVQVAFFFKAVN
jgi:hypothetical protein